MERRGGQSRLWAAILDLCRILVGSRRREGFCSRLVMTRLLGSMHLGFMKEERSELSLLQGVVWEVAVAIVMCVY